MSAAGVLWIVFGAITVVNVAVGVLLVMAAAGGIGGLGSQGGPLLCVSVLLTLFGAVFVHVGVQSVRGTARDTLGNGVGSLIFGLFQSAGGVLRISQGDVVMAGVGLLSAAGLLAAGVLALVGRGQYKAWRRAQRAERDRRADGYDARPRQAPRRDD